MKLCDRKHCSGCKACISVCPVNAINMQLDERGFLYPRINEEQCIKCGLCDRLIDTLSLHLKSHEHVNEPIIAYAVKNKNEEKREKSQSGGLFCALAENIINQNGVVYGAGYGEDFSVQHMRISKISNLYKLNGSKYVQSNLNNCLENIIADLKNNMKVLFSGTPCQVAGIESLLKVKKIDCTNFYSCDFICHGVPSPLVYRDFLNFISKKYNSNIIKVNLRDKNEGGWHNHVETIEFKNSKKHTGKIYVNLFYSNLCLRESCENCLYTHINRPADITMADCWGIEKKYPELWNDNKGISLALIQTSKGEKFFDSIKNSLDKVELMKDVYMQPQLMHPSFVPVQKNNFWKFYKRNDFEKSLRKYTEYGGIKFKIKRKILKMLKKW